MLVSPSASVQEGRDVTLTCSSEANPAVNEFTWYTFSKGNKTVIGSGSILTFSQIHREKTGLYCCEVKNIHGISNATVTLDIQCKYCISSIEAAVYISVMQLWSSRFDPVSLYTKDSDLKQ